MKDIDQAPGHHHKILAEVEAFLEQVVPEGVHYALFIFDPVPGQAQVGDQVQLGVSVVSNADDELTHTVLEYFLTVDRITEGNPVAPPPSERH